MNGKLTFKILEEFEEYWQMRLVTVHPYGLNKINEPRECHQRFWNKVLILSSLESSHLYFIFNGLLVLHFTFSKKGNDTQCNQESLFSYKRRSLCRQIHSKITSKSPPLSSPIILCYPTYPRFYMIHSQFSMPLRGAP